MFRLVPPAGMPIPLSAILRAGLRRLFIGGDEDRLAQKIRSLASIKHCFFLNSGRAAQMALLKSMSEIAGPGKDEVVIPAYTCYSVAASIVRAGLKLRPVDIDPLTMDYRYDKLEITDFSRVLAVVECNLFGIIGDWSKLQSLKDKHRILLIDDAAQSFGSLVLGKYSGTLGDAGFYSLDRGKNLTTYSGGILLTDNEAIAGRIRTALAGISQPSFGHDLVTMTKTVLYSFLLRPRFYWLPNKMPFLKLGETVYDRDFVLSILGRFQQSLGVVLIDHLASVNSTRRENARKLADAFSESKRFQIPGIGSSEFPRYLRLPVLAPDRQTRDCLARALRGKGIMASSMYPQAIPDLREVKDHLIGSQGDFSGARQIPSRLLTLPIHPYVVDSDIENMISCIHHL